MALEWEWSEKCGSATLYQYHEGKTENYTLSLYQGNAYLIFIHEYEEEGKEKYTLYSFWLDKQHMKNCLGLNKKGGFTKNIYNDPYECIIEITLNKKRCRNVKDISAALVQAFDNIMINIVSREE